MNVIPREEMLAPNLCVVCESTPSAGVVVDTLKRIEGFSKLAGRKYVCEQCVKQFAGLLGYESGTQVQKASWERDLARNEVAQIRKRIDEFAKTLGEVVNHPGVASGATYEQVFAPETVDAVREAQQPRVELPEGAAATHTIGSTDEKESSGSAGSKK